MQVDQPTIAPDHRLRARFRLWRDHKVRAWASWIDRLPDGGYAVRIGAGACLLALAMTVLLGLNVALRSGLWGDLAFALVVVTAVLWALYRATQPLLRRNKPFQAFPRALSAAVMLLVGSLSPLRRHRSESS